MLNEKKYIDLMVPFYNFVRQEVRRVDENLSYYGTGEAGHWAIQSNFNVAGALAVLANTAEDIPPDKNELRDLALRLFRYNLSAHQTGNGHASCGNKWGCSWISILGLERMVAGQLALEPYFTDADRDAFRKLRLAEADFLLTYDIVAGMCADDKVNKPESNYWNGSFLYRVYIDYPDAPNRQAYLEKSCAFLLNAISHPLDAAGTDFYLGKELRHWHIGFNFTPNYSLDHHGYMNVGYSIITLSHAAYLYFYCKARNHEFPDFARLHLSDLWKVVKNFIFPDGRLLRLGGDSRARYCYCQMYLLPILMMMKDLGDPDALQFESGMLSTIAREQLDNPDGSFFGTRLADMKIICRYYYTRLESDPFAALSFCADFRRRFGGNIAPQTVSAPPVEWEDAFHAANLVRSEQIVRSMVRRGAEGPVALALPLADSSLAEWCGNGHAQILGRASLYHEISKFNRSFKGGFISSGDAEITERYPVGEGEGLYVIANSSAACAALPDGKSMIILEKAHVVKEHMLFDHMSFFQNYHTFAVRQSGTGGGTVGNDIEPFTFTDRVAFRDLSIAGTDKAAFETAVEFADFMVERSSAQNLSVTVTAPFGKRTVGKRQSQSHRTFRAAANHGTDDLFRTDEVGGMESILPLHRGSGNGLGRNVSAETAAEVGAEGKSGKGVGFQAGVIIAADDLHISEAGTEERAVRIVELFAGNG